MNNSRSRTESLFPANSGRNIVTPGIHTKLKCEASYVSTDKYEAIKLLFTNEDGETFSNLCFRPTKGYNRTVEREDGTSYTETDSEALFRTENETLSHVARLAHLANANLIQDIEDFKGMAEHLIEIVNSEKELYNIKLVLDKNDKYLNLGKYANSSIELYKEGKTSTLKIGPKDNMGNAGNSSSDSDLDMPTSSKGDDDLPF